MTFAGYLSRSIFNSVKNRLALLNNRTKWAPMSWNLNSPNNSKLDEVQAVWWRSVPGIQLQRMLLVSKQMIHHPRPHNVFCHWKSRWPIMNRRGKVRLVCTAFWSVCNDWPYRKVAKRREHRLQIRNLVVNSSEMSSTRCFAAFVAPESMLDGCEDVVFSENPISRLVIACSMTSSMIRS